MLHCCKLSCFCAVRLQQMNKVLLKRSSVPAGCRSNAAKGYEGKGSHQQPLLLHQSHANGIQRPTLSLDTEVKDVKVPVIYLWHEAQSS